MVQASTLPSNESPGAGGRSFIQRRIQGQARSWELTCRSSGPQPLALIPRHARSSAATGGRGSPAPWTAPQPYLHPPSPPRLERSLFPVRSPTARTESRHERVSPHSPGQHLPRGRPGKQSDHPPRRLTHGLPQIQRHESQHRRHRQDRGRLRCSRFLDQEPTESKIHEPSSPQAIHPRVQSTGRRSPEHWQARRPSRRRTLHQQQPALQLEAQFAGRAARQRRSARRENALLRQENDILKKAAVIRGTRLPSSSAK